jgi:hypothetical protein
MKKLTVLLFLFACGRAPSNDPTPVPVPKKTGGGELTFNSDVKPLLTSYCAECHSDATFISNENSFLNSKAPTRIANKSMPQRQSKNFAKWSDAQRAIVAAFVEESR